MPITFSAWKQRNQQVLEQAQAYDQSAMHGETRPSYKFNHNVLGGDDLHITESSIQIPGYKNAVDISQPNPFNDYFKV